MKGGKGLSEQINELFQQSQNEFIAAVRDGREQEIARSISLLEDKSPLSREIMKQLYQNFNKPYIIGITGPAGSGKSSLLNLMLKEWLKEPELKIAVIAVDPTSQRSGGAFLGDRIRMKDINNDQRIFIRSMASRGKMGGVNSAVYDTAVIMAAAGYEMIVIETVGVGQTEIDVVSLADTTLVVTVPEAGDEIQIFKSELMEVGDIFILNKDDLPRAAKMEVLLKSNFSLIETEKLNRKNEYESKGSWQSVLLKTSVLNNHGIKDLVKAVENHYNYLRNNNILEQNKKLQLKKHLLNLLQSEILEKIILEFDQEDKLDKYLRDILSGEASPYQLIEEFIDKNLTIQVDL